MKDSYSLFKNQLINSILSCPIIYINHYHYLLIDEILGDIFEDAMDYSLTENCVLEYDSGQGCVVNFKNKCIDKEFEGYKSLKSILKVLIDPNAEVKNVFKKESESLFSKKRIFLLKGLCREMVGESELSLMQTFALKYENGEYENCTSIIIVSPHNVGDLPLSLRKYATIMDILPPSVEEIRRYIESKVGENVLRNSRQKKDAEDMVRTLQGLQMYEVKQTLKTVLLLTGGRINEKAIRLALEEKKRIVKKSGIIEVIDTDVSFDDVGGLGRLIEDLEIKSRIYANLGDAVKYNIPIPKGILIIGMPGCGKSMIAQATANKFGVSLLRLDVSRLMGKYVGESEANLRMALATAEAAHPCVLWIDEIEKAFAGSNNSSGDNDMLVMRMMGHFLTWMQERKTPVYIVATANDVMRPEFMRKGRFDEVYFVDFPNEDERAQILDKKIKKRYPNNDNCIFDFSEINCKEIVKNMKGEYGGFSGSEIECVLNMVVEEKFSNYLAEKSKLNNEDYVPEKMKVSKSDFDKVIERISKSVMCNQKSNKISKDDMYRDKTAIERIKDMQKIYQFTDAKIV